MACTLNCKHSNVRACCGVACFRGPFGEGKITKDVAGRESMAHTIPRFHNFVVYLEEFAQHAPACQREWPVEAVVEFDVRIDAKQVIDGGRQVVG